MKKNNKILILVVFVLAIIGEMGLYCNGWAYEVKVPEELK